MDNVVAHKTLGLGDNNMPESHQRYRQPHTETKPIAISSSVYASANTDDIPNSLVQQIEEEPPVAKSNCMKYNTGELLEKINSNQSVEDKLDAKGCRVWFSTDNTGRWSSEINSLEKKSSPLS